MSLMFKTPASQEEFNASLPIISMGRSPGYPEPAQTLLDDNSDTDVKLSDWINTSESQVSDDAVGPSSL